jgi:hypothetical protein
MTAVYLLNRSPTRSLEGKTPYEAWHDKKPGVHHLRTFGCVVYMKVTHPHLTKLDDRGKKEVFIGYKAGTKGYRVFDTVEGRVHVSRDVVFDEGIFWSWNIDDSAPRLEPFTVEYTYTEPRDGGAPSAAPASPAPTLTPPVAGAGARIPDGTPAPVMHVTPPSNDHERHDALSGQHLRYRKMGEIIGNYDPPGQAVSTLDITELHAISSEELSTFAEAERAVESGHD